MEKSYTFAVFPKYTIGDKVKVQLKENHFNGEIHKIIIIIEKSQIGYFYKIKMKFSEELIIIKENGIIKFYERR